MPDQVFFGLIFGSIKGPLKKFPKMYAEVSLMNDIKIIKKTIDLSIPSKRCN